MSDSSTPPTHAYLRFAYLPRDAGGFILPILTRLRSAASPHLMRLSAEWEGSANAADAVAITTKLAMLSVVVVRLNESIADLRAEIDGATDLEDHITRGAGWISKDRELPYRILVDLDSFLFEFRSCYELVGRLLPRVIEGITGKRVTEQEMLAKLGNAGLDAGWASTLRKHRILYFHEISPWFIVRLPDTSTDRRDLIFTAGPSGDPANGLSFVEIRAIHSGLLQALQVFQMWMIQEIESVERRGR